MDYESKNIAETLAAELPKPYVLFVDAPNNTERAGSVTHVAVPKGYALHTADNEKLLAHPRRTVATATMGEEASFVDYVLRHAEANSVVWCSFNPTNSHLEFTAVFDEHAGKGPAGWRGHKATFNPALSAEWTTWTAHNKQAKSQLAFAEFIEQNEVDISEKEGYPTSLQMMKLATEFEARAEQRVKSTLRLQSGGVRLEYVADPDKGTIEAMQVYDKFLIGVPVFWTVQKPGEAIPAYHVRARLRYRLGQGGVTFHYELIRPDLVHQQAAKELIDRVRAAIGPTPLLMGACT